MNKKTEMRLREPGAAYRGKPFWAWNGALDEAELLRQIDCMRAMGFGGFFMYSRTGLDTEYLGGGRMVSPYSPLCGVWGGTRAGGMAVRRRSLAERYLRRHGHFRKSEQDAFYFRIRQRSGSRRLRGRHSDSGAVCAAVCGGRFIQR